MIQKTLLEELEKRRAAARAGGGQDKLDARRKKGVMTARDRIEATFPDRHVPGIRPACRPRLPQLRHGGKVTARRWRGHGHRHRGWPRRGGLQPGFYRRRRRAGTHSLQENLRPDGLRPQDRLPGDRFQRFGRRAHSGRRSTRSPPTARCFFATSCFPASCRKLPLWPGLARAARPIRLP